MCYKQPSRLICSVQLSKHIVCFESLAGTQEWFHNWHVWMTIVDTDVHTGMANRNTFPKMATKIIVAQASPTKTLLCI